MAYTQKIEWEALRTLNSASLGALYVNLGGPLLFSSFKLKVVNLSNVTVLVSKNGTSAIDVAPMNSFFLYDEDVTINHEAIPAGTQISVLSTTGAAGVGNIYLVTQYLVLN